MKKAGIGLIVTGVISGIFALIFFETTVSTGMGRVHNIGLMDERRNYLMVAGLAVVIGVILLVFRQRNGTGPLDQGERRSTVASERTPSSLPFPLQRSLDLDAYQLYLVKKFNIGKNDVLSKFVVNETLFPTIDEALKFAHALDVDAEEQERVEGARQALVATAIEAERLRVESAAAGVVRSKGPKQAEGVALIHIEALNRAIAKGDLATVKGHLVDGLDVEAANQWGLTPILAAKQHHRKEILALLEEHRKQTKQA